MGGWVSLTLGGANVRTSTFEYGLKFWRSRKLQDTDFETFEVENPES